MTMTLKDYLASLPLSLTVGTLKRAYIALWLSDSEGNLTQEQINNDQINELYAALWLSDGEDNLTEEQVKRLNADRVKKWSSIYIKNSHFHSLTLTTCFLRDIFAVLKSKKIDDEVELPTEVLAILRIYFKNLAAVNNSAKPLLDTFRKWSLNYPALRDKTSTVSPKESQNNQATTFTREEVFAALEEDFATRFVEKSKSVAGSSSDKDSQKQPLVDKYFHQIKGALVAFRYICSDAGMNDIIARYRRLIIGKMQPLVYLIYDPMTGIIRVQSRQDTQKGEAELPIHLEDYKDEATIRQGLPMLITSICHAYMYYKEQRSLTTFWDGLGNGGFCLDARIEALLQEFQRAVSDQKDSMPFWKQIAQHGDTVRAYCEYVAPSVINCEVINAFYFRALFNMVPAYSDEPPLKAIKDSGVYDSDVLPGIDPTTLPRSSLPLVLRSSQDTSALDFLQYQPLFAHGGIFSYGVIVRNSQDSWVHLLAFEAFFNFMMHSNLSTKMKAEMWEKGVKKLASMVSEFCARYSDREEFKRFSHQATILTFMMTGVITNEMCLVPSEALNKIKKIVAKEIKLAEDFTEGTALVDFFQRHHTLFDTLELLNSILSCALQSNSTNEDPMQRYKIFECFFNIMMDSKVPVEWKIALWNERVNQLTQEIAISYTSHLDPEKAKKLFYQAAIMLFIMTGVITNAMFLAPPEALDKIKKIAVARVTVAEDFKERTALIDFFQRNRTLFNNEDLFSSILECILQNASSNEDRREKYKILECFLNLIMDSNVKAEWKIALWNKEAKRLTQEIAISCTSEPDPEKAKTLSYQTAIIIFIMTGVITNEMFLAPPETLSKIKEILAPEVKLVEGFKELTALIDFFKGDRTLFINENLFSSVLTYILQNVSTVLVNDATQRYEIYNQLLASALLRGGPLRNPEIYKKILRPFIDSPDFLATMEQNPYYLIMLVTTFPEERRECTSFVIARMSQLKTAAMMTEVENFLNQNNEEKIKETLAILAKMITAATMNFGDHLMSRFCFIFIVQIHKLAASRSQPLLTHFYSLFPKNERNHPPLELKSLIPTYPDIADNIRNIGEFIEFSDNLSRQLYFSRTTTFGLIKAFLSGNEEHLIDLLRRGLFKKLLANSFVENINYGRADLWTRPPLTNEEMERLFLLVDQEIPDLEQKKHLLTCFWTLLSHNLDTSTGPFPEGAERIAQQWFIQHRLAQVDFTPGMTTKYLVALPIKAIDRIVEARIKEVASQSGSTTQNSGPVNPLYNLSELLLAYLVQFHTRYFSACRPLPASEFDSHIEMVQKIIQNPTAFGATPQQITPKFLETLVTVELPKLLPTEEKKGDKPAQARLCLRLFNPNLEKTALEKLKDELTQFSSLKRFDPEVITILVNKVCAFLKNATNEEFDDLKKTLPSFLEVIEKNEKILSFITQLLTELQKTPETIGEARRVALTEALYLPNLMEGNGYPKGFKYVWLGKEDKESQDAFLLRFCRAWDPKKGSLLFNIGLAKETTLIEFTKSASPLFTNLSQLPAQAFRGPTEEGKQYANYNFLHVVIEKVFNVGGKKTFQDYLDAFRATIDMISKVAEEETKETEETEEAKKAKALLLADRHPQLGTPLFLYVKSMQERSNNRLKLAETLRDCFLLRLDLTTAMLLGPPNSNDNIFHKLLGIKRMSEEEKTVYLHLIQNLAQNKETAALIVSPNTLGFSPLYIALKENSTLAKYYLERLELLEIKVPKEVHNEISLRDLIKTQFPEKLSWFDENHEGDEDDVVMLEAPPQRPLETITSSMGSYTAPHSPGSISASAPMPGSKRSFAEIEHDPDEEESEYPGLRQAIAASREFRLRNDGAASSSKDNGNRDQPCSPMKPGNDDAEFPGMAQAIEDSLQDKKRWRGG